MILKLTIMLGLSIFLNGCVFTKVVTVPMRVAGAVISIIPVVGNTAHSGIDTAAEVVDELPL